MKLFAATTVIALLGATFADYAQPPTPDCGPSAPPPSYPSVPAPAPSYPAPAPAPSPSYSMGVQETPSQSSGYESAPVQSGPPVSATGGDQLGYSNDAAPARRFRKVRKFHRKLRRFQ